CRRENVTESAFYAWRRTIAGRDGEAKRAQPRKVLQRPAFVPVVVEGDSRRDGAITIELAGGRVLRLPEATPTQRAGHPPREGGEAVGCSVAANPPGSWCLLGSCSG